jgi:plasmid maintenance system antidote protein VapI
MAARKRQLSDQLRDLIECSEHSRYRIAQETGVDAAVLCHFVAGRRGLSIESIDALGEFFDLKLVHRSERKR